MNPPTVHQQQQTVHQLQGSRLMALQILVLLTVPQDLDPDQDMAHLEEAEEQAEE